MDEPREGRRMFLTTFKVVCEQVTPESPHKVFKHVVVGIWEIVS